MATKKEKRARGLARREEYLKQVEADGLAALKAELERREKEKLEAERETQARQEEMLRGRSKTFARMAKNGKTPVKDPRKFDPDLISHPRGDNDGVLAETMDLLADIIDSRRGKPNLKRELTVGEYLDAANKLLPVFSEK